MDAQTSRRGSVLLLVVVIGAVLLVLMAALLQSSIAGSTGATATQQHAAAHYTALSGIFAACSSLSSGGRGNTSGTATTTWSPMEPEREGFVFSADDVFRGMGDGYFESRAARVGAMWVVRARGFHGGTFRTLEGHARPTGAAGARPFRRGLFAEGDLSIDSGASFDSYDSRLGAHSTHPTTVTDRGRAIKRQGGDIASEASILLDSNTVVFGDARPGVDATISISAEASVSGSTASLSAPVDNPDPAWTAPSPTDPDLAAVPGVGYDEALALGAGTTTIGPGRYVLSALQLRATAAVTFTGGSDELVEIYLTGRGVSEGATFLVEEKAEVRLASDGPTVRIYNAGALAAKGRINAGGEPPTKFIYLAAGADARVDLHSNATVVGAFYAPSAPARIDANVAFFGGLVAAETIVSSNLAFHYDEALADLELPLTTAGSTFSLVAVRELR